MTPDSTRKETLGAYTTPVLRPTPDAVPFASAATDIDPQAWADHCPICRNLAVDCLCESAS